MTRPSADDRPLSWTSSGRSDVGSVRELNEDAFLERPDLGLWLVADGMGGHYAGDVASRMLVSAMDELDAPESLSGFVESVERRLLEVNERLREYAEREETHTIGSTVVALLIHGRHAVCLWAGDSRMYRYRDQRLEQISQDHALVEELVERGVLTPEQAIDHPHANLVTRAVGAADRLFVDIEIVALQPGDVFILCSDGLEQEVAEEEIALAPNGREPQALSAALLERALAYGARDNVTVITVAIDEPSPREAPDAVGDAQDLQGANADDEPDTAPSEPSRPL